MKITKTCAFLAIAALSITTLTGCGERGAERKIGKAAQKYIMEKYGIEAEVTEVELRHVGELEGVWHKKDGGYATMAYQGRTFRTYVDIKDGDYACDNYKQADYAEQFTQYFSEALQCDDIYVSATYGAAVQCGVTADIKTFEDLTAKCDNIRIIVSVYGLDRDSIQNVDASLFGEKTEIRVIDWSEAASVRDEDLLIENATEPYSFTFGKIRSYYTFKDGNVTHSLL